jgi:CheY-like chemotaxis protein
MAVVPSSDQLAQFRDDARLLARRTGDHQQQLEALVAEAEREVRSAETAMADAVETGIDQAGEIFRSALLRAARSARTVTQLCVSARDDHDAALRLLRHLDEGCDPDVGSVRSRPDAVLVVDDYADTRELVSYVLQTAGFVVRTAANGLEGLIAAYEMRPGVIVMDVTMPVLDGIEATRLIKTYEATREARVIAYTADATIAGGAFEKLFVAVLDKPAPPDVLLAAVHRAACL